MYFLCCYLCFINLKLSYALQILNDLSHTCVFCVVTYALQILNDLGHTCVFCVVTYALSF